MKIFNKRLFLALPLILFLLLLIFQSFNRGISSIFFINFEYFTTSPVLKENLNNAKSILKTTNSFSANNPQFYQHSGVIKTLKSNVVSTVIERKNLLNTASDDYIQSLIYQPDNPFSWLNLAQNSFYLGDDNYRNYLDKALKYGRSEQVILIGFFNLSLLHWHTIEKERQNRIIDLLQKTILAKDFLFKDSGKKLNYLLKAHHLKYKLCSKMVRSKKIRAFCKLKD